MKPNIWIYANNIEQQNAADSLIVFGAEVFMKAKLIHDINILKTILKELDKNRRKSLPPTDINEFIFEYLIDCVRILIFFENYMKAKLIVQDFCIHTINKDYNDFKDLAKKQYKEPIALKEISALETFEVHIDKRMIIPNAIKETTLGIKVLLGSAEYLKHYDFDKHIIEYIKEIILIRNKLHLHTTMEFKLSELFISKIERLIEFVNTTLRSIRRL